MNEKAIENLKLGMNDKVSNHFEPLKKINTTLLFLELVSDDELQDKHIRKIIEIREWAYNVFNTGNIACNLNIILQNQNLALFTENKKLKEENEKLLATIGWNNEQ